MNSLIISTGDVSDVDGFYALAVYAKTGSDCLFIMNYPSYVSDPPVPNKNAADPGLLAPGLGYSYPAATLQTKGNSPVSAFRDGADAHMKLTNYGYSMAKYVWEETKPKGRLFFQIGGVNEINPFSAGAIKIEPAVYQAAFAGNKPIIDISQIGCQGKCVEGMIFTTDQTTTKDFSLENYEEIKMDFCGSMAFLTDAWLGQLEAVAGKVKGIFVMGGVRADVVPETMSAMPKVLNRFSCATMNQLYHPENSAKFFDFLEKHNPRPDVLESTGHQGPTFPVFIVTNNSVPDLKTVEAVEAFLDANGLTKEAHPFLRTLEEKYYQSAYAPPKKQVFDFYAAAALVSDGGVNGPYVNIYYDVKYGVTLVAPVPKMNGKNSVAALKMFGERLDEKIAWAKGIPPLAGAIPGFEAEKNVVTGMTADQIHVYHGARNVKYNRDTAQVVWNISNNI